MLIWVSFPQSSPDFYKSTQSGCRECQSYCTYITISALRAALTIYWGSIQREKNDSTRQYRFCLFFPRLGCFLVKELGGQASVLIGVHGLIPELTFALNCSYNNFSWRAASSCELGCSTSHHIVFWTILLTLQFEHSKINGKYHSNLYLLQNWMSRTIFVIFTDMIVHTKTHFVGVIFVIIIFNKVSTVLTLNYNAF